MPANDAFEHNGISIITSEPPPPMGPPGEDVVAWVVTAPDKHADVNFSMPFRVANNTLAAMLDTTGNELGTGWHAATETLKKTQVTQYFIVMPEGADDNETMNNILGGVDAATGRKTGIAALAECPERPTIIAAPGFSANKPVADALAVMGKKLMCRAVIDGPSGGTQTMIDFSAQFGGEGTGHERLYVAVENPMIYSKAAGADIYVPPSIHAVGAMASRKQWESPGNAGVLINDVSRTIDYNILDKTTEGDLLNKHGLSFYARTTMGGFSLIGNRSITGKFISFVGLEDTIARKLEAASQRAMSKNLTMSFMEQEVKKINLFMQDLVAAEIIPGGEVYLHPELNTVERYKNGSWYIVVDYGRFSPNEHMIFHLNAVDRIVEEFLEEVL